jgi:hypothetical protein
MGYEGKGKGGKEKNRTQTFLQRRILYIVHTNTYSYIDNTKIYIW